MEFYVFKVHTTVTRHPSLFSDISYYYCEYKNISDCDFYGQLSGMFTKVS